MRVAVVPNDFQDANCANVVLVRPGPSIDANYLACFIRSPAAQRQLLRNRVGSAQTVVNTRVVKNWEIPLPPLDEQERIAGILDAADALRAKRCEALAQLDTLLQSTFLDMFGDPVTNPLGWEITPLGSAFELKHGYAFKSTHFVSEGEYVLLTPGNFFEKGGFRDRGEKQRFHNEPVPQEYVLEEGDLLVAMTEQAPGLLGSPILVPKSRRFLHNQRLGKVVKRIGIDSAFIFELMNTSSIRARIQQDSTGTKVKHTSPKKIAAIEIGIPPLDLQRRFATIVESVEQQKAAQRAHLAEIDTLFASLQSRAFRGDL